MNGFLLPQVVRCVRGTLRRQRGSCRFFAPGMTMTLISGRGNRGALCRLVTNMEQQWIYHQSTHVKYACKKKKTSKHQSTNFPSKKMLNVKGKGRCLHLDVDMMWCTVVTILPEITKLIAHWWCSAFVWLSIFCPKVYVWVYGSLKSTNEKFP